jgi:predicted ribosome quality control (RQC) complex YloA/Tae2 family protein
MRDDLDDLDDDSDDLDAAPAPAAADPAAARRASVTRALRRYAGRLGRKLDGLREDLAEAEGAPQWRRFGEALLAYARDVPARAARVTLPDPADPGRTLEIELDPNVAAPANAARYFKRAAKGERGLRDIPQRVASVEAERAQLLADLAALADAADDAARAQAELALERTLFALGATVRQQLRAPQPLSRRELALPPAGAAARPNAPTSPARPAPRPGELPAKLTPWRFRTLEGWDVLIGRTSEGNDHLTVHVARPEDYWFHAHGCAGSHVVLRRGKGPNEPSRATLEEVASWAAFHSKARTAGKVPVNYTQKKYVRKPRGAKPGLVYIEREKTLLVRPVEPPRERMSDVVDAADAADDASGEES